MARSRPIELDGSWQTLLGDEFELPYMRDLSDFLRAEKQAGKRIYPSGDSIFAAFNATPVAEVKVVILGQDPYHGPGQAHGLCFSVQPGVEVPPSLRNILKELNDDLETPVQPTSGSLQGWADQGVLLLNSVLTVEQHRAGSHQGRGWERFTDAVVSKLAQTRSQIVFLLWGSYAHKKGAVVSESQHCVLRAPHPSPLSAHRGFLGCKHFSKANDYLLAHNIQPIVWQQTEASSQ